MLLPARTGTVDLPTVGRSRVDRHITFPAAETNVMTLSSDPVRRAGRSAGTALRSGLRRAAFLLALCGTGRSEEHTSELQSLMRISYDVFCLKNTNTKRLKTTPHAQ